MLMLKKTAAKQHRELKRELAVTRGDLAAVAAKYNSAQAELMVIRGDLEAFRKTNRDAASLETEVTLLKKQLTDTENALSRAVASKKEKKIVKELKKRRANAKASR